MNMPTVFDSLRFMIEFITEYGVAFICIMLVAVTIYGVYKLIQSLAGERKRKEPKLQGYDPETGSPIYVK